MATMENATITKYCSNKTVLFAGPGVDQLGRQVGLPLPGDVVKLHMMASYSALRPMFGSGRGSFNFGSVKLREKEFLDTNLVGDTAFFVVQIPSKAAPEHKQPQSVADVLMPMVQDMVLGETAQFVLDVELMDDHVKNLFFNTTEKLHKGHYKKLPADALKLTIVLDSFRIARGKTDHRRPNRNGTGYKNNI